MLAMLGLLLGVVVACVGMGIWLGLMRSRILWAGNWIVGGCFRFVLGFALCLPYTGIACCYGVDIV